MASTNFTTFIKALHVFRESPYFLYLQVTYENYQQKLSNI